IKDQSFYFENALEFLDDEGEWFLTSESHELFYKARREEDIGSIVFVAPRLVRLLQVQGKPDAPIKHIHFVDLVFQDSTWLEPSEEGFATHQADNIFKGTQLGYQIPAAIHVQDAENLRFEHNTFRNMGATAVSLWGGVRDTVLLSNTFEDIAASAISIAMNLTERRGDPSETCRNNIIQNNFIQRAGRDYHSSVGIFAGYTEGLVIDHNELTDLPYTGISVGWGWTLKKTALKNNLIRRNRIHNVMNQLADGGGIYTLSRQPGTTIIENHVFNMARSAWAGFSSLAAIYLDEGSSLITLKDNLLENVPVGIDFHRAQDNTIINNRSLFQERWQAYNNHFLDDGTIDLKRIRANAGIGVSGSQ
ncbi:MAG: right-handed parallel beta-helix repeat-containing protein, partial [Nitrospiraceae bacterium]